MWGGGGLWGGGGYCFFLFCFVGFVFEYGFLMRGVARVGEEKGEH